MIDAHAVNGFGLRVEDFAYALPPELIAQTPLPERDASRLLVLDRATGRRHHSKVRDLGKWLAPGDLLVVNNSRVIPARLHARRVPTRGRVELLLLRRAEDGSWTALAKPARRLRPGSRLAVSPLEDRGLPDAELEVVAVSGEGQITVEFENGSSLRLEDYGAAPMPPYIGGMLDDPERYQTVYASVAGSAAAPTAGLHFTPALLDALKDQGVGCVEVTLHVGLDTFRPVAVDRVGEHRIHREWCSVGEEAARAIAAAKQTGGRVVAVGTTVARTLETLSTVWSSDAPSGWTGMTDLFIVPGYRWRLVDGLLTNFHLPRSTLLMMVSALVGVEQIRAAYAEAIAERYRFFSFGDAMLIR